MFLFYFIQFGLKLINQSIKLFKHWLALLTAHIFMGFIYKLITYLFW